MNSLIVFPSPSMMFCRVYGHGANEMTNNDNFFIMSPCLNPQSPPTGQAHEKEIDEPQTDAGMGDH
jgi:hypothetical protein